MTTRALSASIVLAALAGLAMLLVSAPEYVAARGFPLDDAWIHAVYGRAVARSASFSYNPGIAATGATAPLWAVLLAGPHLLAANVGAIVLLTKLLGFVLHVLAALLLFHALGEGADLRVERLVGTLLVALHPDLVSAALSGMETPLAVLGAAAMLYTARADRMLPYAIVSAVAPLARPELAALSYVLPLLLWVRRDRRVLRTLWAAALLGDVVSFGGLAVRNIIVSGLPLPATFYAKAGGGGLPIVTAELVGFNELLGRIVIIDASVLVTLAFAVAILVLLALRPHPAAAAAAACVSGLTFCALSFVLVRPVDPDTFYHQRYILPVIPFLVGSMPALIDEGLRRCLPVLGRRAVGVALLVLVVGSLLGVAPARYRRLSNDAQNIDDVQVAMGRTLAAAPASDVVWATDAGAIRYFGNALVVDLMGLNNAQLLFSGAQAFLDAHAPRYFEIVPTWARLDEASSQQLEAMPFKTSTPYTVTNVAAMETQFLVRCPGGAPPGQLTVRNRSFHFVCAP